MIEMLSALREAALTEARPALRETNAAGLAERLERGKSLEQEEPNENGPREKGAGVDEVETPEVDGAKLLSIEGGKTPPWSDLAGQFVRFDSLAERLTPGRLAMLDPSVAGREGIQFKDNGCPDFTPFAAKEVEADGLGENRAEDTKRAYELAGVDEDDYPNHVWHHVEDGRTMQLVPSDLHSVIPHTGGVSVVNALKDGREVRNYR